MDYTPDRILRDLGIWRRPWWKRLLRCGNPPRLDDDAYSILVESLRHFLKAGGVVTWDLWRSVTNQTRAALMHAGELVESERAAKYGIASQGQMEAAIVLQEVDGGDLRTQVALDMIAGELN